MALEQLQWAIGYLRWSGIAGARHTTAVLDRNRDGSIMDDVTSMMNRFMKR